MFAPCENFLHSPILSADAFNTVLEPHYASILVPQVSDQFNFVLTLDRWFLTYWALIGHCTYSSVTHPSLALFTFLMYL